MRTSFLGANSAQSPRIILAIRKERGILVPFVAYGDSCLFGLEDKGDTEVRFGLHCRSSTNISVHF